MEMSTGIIIVLVLLLIIAVLWLSDVQLKTRAVDYQKRASAWYAAQMGSQATPAATTTGAMTASAQTPIVVSPVSTAKTETFCPKLMQKYGFCDAGEKMNPRRGTFYDSAPMAVLPAKRGGIHYEGFRATGPGYNTMWSGYMGSSTLPL